jgi:hypothetical protein
MTPRTKTGLAKMNFGISYFALLPSNFCRTRKCVCKKIEPSKPAPGNHDTRIRELCVRCDTGWYAQCNECPICFFPFFRHVFGFILQPFFMLPFVLASISRSSVLVSIKNICQLPIPHPKEISRWAIKQSKLTGQDPTPQQQRAECWCGRDHPSSPGRR